MAFFVKVENNIVTEALIAEQSYINTGDKGDPSLWHNLPSGLPDYKRDGNLGVGFTYDPVTLKYISPQPYSSWSYDAVNNQWLAPVPYPLDGGIYKWDEISQAWELMS